MLLIYHISPYVLIAVLILISTTDGRIQDESPISNHNLIHSTSVINTTHISGNNTKPSPCFYADLQICKTVPPKSNEISTNKPNICECFLHPTVHKSLVCCNITNIERVTSCLTNRDIDSSPWNNLHLYNATLDELDVSHYFWKQLDSMIVTDGNIRKISKDFTRFSSLKCLNFSNNNLSEINARAFKELTHLQVLDISHNNLSTMPNRVSVPSNLTVNISGNSAISCKSVLESIERGGFKFVEPDTTLCLINKTFSWFNSTESIPLRQLERMKQLQTECPSIPGSGNCTCEAERMSFLQQDKDTLLIFTAKVDCSGLGLTELPRNLPQNTLSLNVSRNKIKSLSAFNDDPTYKNLVRLDADDNLIETMLELEGTKFIEEFQQLNLKKNKLKSIPIYIISNRLDRNPRGVEVHLAGNRLHCNCDSAKTLRLWLLARQHHILDYDKILCDNMQQNVLDLSETRLCQSPHDWTDYIYYLIAAEVFLLIALIMKVSYDYWIFKTAGYLPWPANKMPKLPCDWLCES